MMFINKCFDNMATISTIFR